MSIELTSWNDGAAKSAITDFVARVCDQNGPDYVEPAARVAVFDNDGTLWCEKPMPIQLDFTVRRLAELAHGDPSLRRDRDFMRPVAGELYGIPPERVIGSALGLSYAVVDGSNDLLYKAAMDFFDDGPEKPVRIWSRIGRRPILAGGNSNGDIPMLAYSGTDSTPSLRLLLLHDDAEREFDYTAGAEQALEVAQAEDWTVVSIKHDWSQVFAAAAP